MIPRPVPPPVATVSRGVHRMVPVVERSTVLRFGVQATLLANVTVQAVEAPFVPPVRTVVGEQLHDSARLGFGTLELTLAQLHLAPLPGCTSISPVQLPAEPISSEFCPQVAQVGMSTKPSATPFVPSLHFSVIGSGKTMKESSHLPSPLLSQVVLVPTFSRSPQLSPSSLRKGPLPPSRFSDPAGVLNVQRWSLRVPIGFKDSRAARAV